MKRQLLLSLAATVVLGTFLMAGCANPLESTPKPEPLQQIDTLLLMDTMFMSESVLCTDTLFVSDSVLFTDTVVIVDTLREVDTVIVTDSIFRVDTVVVAIPDSTECGRMCAQLSSAQSQITWLLDNAEGLHELDFAALAERNKPPQPLILNIAGETYEWIAQESCELTIELNLPEDATIIITVDQPKALGHSIAVCLTATPL